MDPNVYVYAKASPLVFVDPLGLVTVDCKEGCEELNELRRKFALVLQRIRTGDTKFYEGEEITRIAGTGCKSTPEGAKGFTVFFSHPFSTHPCIHLCAGVHERVHRDQCKELGVEGFYALSTAEAEIPAFDKLLRCLDRAITDGSLELTMRGVEF